jgi:peptidoglycan/xylan/chitin deacetylase (PgdA/CDA1 family)
MPFTRPTWPNNASCAVTLTFDNFGESYDLLRYGHAGGANADGVYAPRRGVERVCDLLERRGISATFFVEGWNARKYADLAREVVARGHELASHGWLHEQWSELAPARERELIQRTTEALSEATGAAPRGWRAPAGLTTTSTLRLLREAGYRYDSSMGDDDVPYLLQLDAGAELAELPWSWPLDDAVYYAHPGTLRRPSAVAGLWKEEFDAAYALTGAFMLVCHPRYTGRPARILALEQLLEHIQSHDNVWFARCDEVDEHIRASAATPRHAAPAVLSAEDV